MVIKIEDIKLKIRIALSERAFSPTELKDKIGCHYYLIKQALEELKEEGEASEEKIGKYTLWRLKNEKSV